AVTAPATNHVRTASPLAIAEKTLLAKTSCFRFTGLCPSPVGAQNSGTEGRVCQRITVQEAVRQLPELLHRVQTEKESFVIVSEGEEVGQLSPVAVGRPATLRSFIELLEQTERPDEDFARDLERIQAEQPVLGEGPWHS